MTFDGCIMSQLESSRSREEKLRRTLHAIAITLGLETWEDLPKGSTDAVCEAVERAVNAKVLAGFVRGQRSARAAEGVDPDALPESATEGMSEREKLIRRDQHRGGHLNPDATLYLLGVIDVIREDRNRLRARFNAEPLQTGTPELLTRAKILGAVHEGYHKGGPIVQDITDSVCELLSSGGSVSVGPGVAQGPPMRPSMQCTAMHGNQQCDGALGHTGPHHEGNEVWSHA